MQKVFPGGVWPVMLTPFTPGGAVDYPALDRLVEWYIGRGVSGLFAVCQSSEMFCLSLEERCAVSRRVVERVGGRVCVVASGHISDTLEEQAAELDAVAAAGVDGVVLLTNLLAGPEESDQVWIERMERLLDLLGGDYPLGLYECPFPYKRIISRTIAEYLARSGRFSFLKDTSCDLSNIGMKLRVFQNTGLQLYNANTSTLLGSLKLGASGYCGVMANFHPELYVHLLKNHEAPEAVKLSDELTMLSLIEKQLYPVNAKYYLSGEGVEMSTACRVKDADDLTATLRDEMEAFRRVTRRMDGEYLNS